MKSITVEGALRSQLEASNTVIELRDEQGRLVGTFVPALSEEDKKRLEPKITKEELDRRQREGGGRSLQEILADLEKRA